MHGVRSALCVFSLAFRFINTALYYDQLNGVQRLTFFAVVVCLGVALLLSPEAYSFSTVKWSL